MPSTTYGDAEQRPPGTAPMSPEADRPDAPQQDVTSTEDIDLAWWERALSDAERAEKPWRARGRDIVQIYRGDIPITRPRSGKYNAQTAYGTKQDTASAFNILYANTEVMLPAAYSKPPDPVVRSRFIKKTADPIQPGMPPPGMPPPGMGPPGAPGPPGMPPPGLGPPPAPPGAGPPGLPPGPPAGPPPPGMPPPPPSPPPPAAGAVPSPPPGIGSPPAGAAMDGGVGGPPPAISPLPPGGGPSPPPPGLGPALPAATPLR
jgi:hypothetical protein